MSVSKILLAVAAVGAGVASAQSSCRASTITVASPAEATIACKTVSGDIVFDKDVAGSVIISGPEKIEGDVIIRNATGLASLSSSTIQKIGGKFELQGLRSLNAITFDALEEVGEISWITLNALETVTFGTDGVTTVKSVRISDTFLSSLEGLNMASVGTFQIDNNPHLTVWETRLSNITEELIVADNSADLTVSFPRLTGGGSLDVRGVKSLSVPLLSELSGSMLLTENNAMESFIAPNLTRTGESVSIRNNDALSNVSFPLLERTVGSLTVQNNQELVKIDGFPKLSTVEGAVTMLGNFTDIELPQLKDVRGAFNVQSTEDIEKSCEAFEEFAPSSDGGNGRFQGSFECVGENENANEGNGKGKKGKDDEDAGALFGVSAPVVLAVAAIGGLIQLL